MNNKRYKLEIACKNSEQLKLTNNDMHSQIEYLKKAYEELHNQLNNKEKNLNIINKKYEILKEHWESLNKDRSNAIEKLKSETQKVNELEKVNVIEVCRNSRRNTIIKD